MVQFYNRQEERYVTLSSPTTEVSSDNLFPETEVKQVTLFEHITEKTRCRGDVSFIKIVLLIVLFWLLALSYKSYTSTEHWSQIKDAMELQDRRGNSKDPRCSFQIGNAVSKIYYHMGSQCEFACINSCTDIRAIDPYINGVTMSRFTDSHLRDCWCESNMTSIDFNEEFRTCKLEVERIRKQEIRNVTKDVRCKFVLGKALSSRSSSKGFLNETRCIDACFKHHSKDSSLNAVTLYSHSLKRSECKCHYNATKTDVDGNFKTCFLDKT